MRFAAVAAIVLISGSMALAQKTKQPTAHEPPAPGVSVHHAVAPAPKAAHQPSTSVKSTPALDLGKNRPVRTGRSSRPTNAGGH